MIFISVLCLISGAFAEGNEELDYNAFDSVMVSGIADFDVVFELLPEAYNATESAHPGTVERLHYTTAVYEDGVTYEKYCTVYLPYGYDPENKETKYNVLYWQHGSGGHPNELWDHQVLGQNAKNMIDNMFDEDHRVMEPCIIICPTYYVGIDESDFKSFKPQDAGDGRENGMLPNYYIEVIHDLIPQIESRYNVYCEDFSEEGIKASRDHRAWAGFSRGSVETWNLMNRDFEYFRYWFPMSAGVMPEGVSADELEEKGYTPSVYGNSKTFTTRLALEKLNKYNKWYAGYPEAGNYDYPLYPYEFDLWQYTETGKVNGITGKVDLNIEFIKK